MILFLVALAVFVALNVADAITTMRVLANGGHESNPALARIMDATGKAWPWIKMALALGAAAIFYHVGPRLETWIALAGLIAAWVYVIRHNLGVLARQRARLAEGKSERMARYAKDAQGEWFF
jgi:hypothetical protein